MINAQQRIFGRSADEVQKDLNQAKEYKVDKNQEEQGKTLQRKTKLVYPWSYTMSY